MKHEFQHEDSPTWCVHCGLFNNYCIPDEECSAPAERKFDMNIPASLENFWLWKVLKHAEDTEKM